MIMNKGTGQMQYEASRLLSQFKDEMPWRKVDAILEYSKNVETKYFALQILEQLVQTRWRSLPRDQCEGIKGYIVSKILDISKAECENDGIKLLLQKLNLVLVQVCNKIYYEYLTLFIDRQIRMASTLAFIHYGHCWFKSQLNLDLYEQFGNFASIVRRSVRF